MDLSGLNERSKCKYSKCCERSVFIVCTKAVLVKFVNYKTKYFSELLGNSKQESNTSRTFK